MLMATWPGCVDVSRLPASGPLRNIDHAIVDGDTFDGASTPDFTVRPDQDPRLHTKARTGERSWRRRRGKPWRTSARGARLTG